METVKTVINQSLRYTRLKPGENEKGRRSAIQR